MNIIQYNHLLSRSFCLKFLRCTLQSCSTQTAPAASPSTDIQSPSSTPEASETSSHGTPQAAENVPPKKKPYTQLDDDLACLVNLRHAFPEFLPSAIPQWRNKTRELLERKDMLRRRMVIDIPEFYVGTIMAVTVADTYNPGKTLRFVGICIQRRTHGLMSDFTLRNVVDNQGMEIRYDLYNPCLLKIEVLKLQKRLDENLLYLRDAPMEYSTFPFNMEAIPHPEGTPVPIDTTMVPLNPRPWIMKWDRHYLKGVILPPDLSFMEYKAEAFYPAYERYDLMKDYRRHIPEGEQKVIWEDVAQHIKEKEERRRRSIDHQLGISSSQAYDPK